LTFTKMPQRQRISSNSCQLHGLASRWLVCSISAQPSGFLFEISRLCNPKNMTSLTRFHFKPLLRTAQGCLCLRIIKSWNRCLPNVYGVLRTFASPHRAPRNAANTYYSQSRACSCFQTTTTRVRSYPSVLEHLSTTCLPFNSDRLLITFSS